jgi:hypothetical protein
MANPENPKNARAELEREREDVEISPAQPLGADRIDDDDRSKSTPSASPSHVKPDDGPRMRH